MSEREVAERIALGMVAGWRTRVEPLEGHAILEVAGIVVAWSGLPDPTQSVGLVEREPVSPLEALEAAERAFESLGGTFGIDLARGRHPAVDAAVARRGHSLVATRPAMAIAIADLEPPRLVDGVVLRGPIGLADLRAMAVVETEAFGTAPDVAARLFHPGLLSATTVRPYLAAVDRRIVATAHVSVHEGALGVFGVGVLPDARRRGIGAAITAFAIHDTAQATGADLAWLQASESGRPVYERMGFEVVSTWDVWVRGVGVGGSVTPRGPRRP